MTFFSWPTENYPARPGTIPFCLGLAAYSVHSSITSSPKSAIFAIIRSSNIIAICMINLFMHA